MGKLRTIHLITEQQKALPEGYQSGKTHTFRQRCQLILLKSEGRTSKQVSQIIKLNRYKRIRRRPKGKPDRELYQIGTEALALLEQQSKQGHIDLFYGDESQLCQEGYVAYGWQFADEDVSIPVAKGGKVNLFGLVSRNNQFFYRLSKQAMTADLIVEQLDYFSFRLQKPTVVVLDNARIHTAHTVKERLPIWQSRGLFIFCLPAYSPDLNRCERVWKELKARWIKPEEYLSADSLFYALTLALAAIGKSLHINFTDFNL